MKKITATIERNSDGGYSTYCDNEMFSGMGDSAQEAQNNMIASIEFFKQTAIEDGRKYPSWIDGSYEIIYKFDTQSLLEYYSGIITPAALERLTGINKKQIWSYAHGKSKPRAAQVKKIENGLHRFAQELMSITL